MREKSEVNTKKLIQGVPGGNVNIMGDHSIGHSKQNNYKIATYSVTYGKLLHFLLLKVSFHLHSPITIFSTSKVYVYICPIPNGFRDTAISLHSAL
jgi:hypothetical protein